MKIDKQIKLEIEAATFRQLKEHLERRTDVQKIDLMNLAGFCRNCLSRWYQEAAQERNIEMSKNQARDIFYNMPFAEWKAKYQIEASDEAKELYDSNVAVKHK